MPRSVERLLAGSQLSLLEVRFLTYLEGAGVAPAAGLPQGLGPEPTTGDVLPKALVTLLDHLHHVSASHGKRFRAFLLIAQHNRVLPWNLGAQDTVYQTARSTLSTHLPPPNPKRRVRP